MLSFIIILLVLVGSACLFALRALLKGKPTPTPVMLTHIGVATLSVLTVLYLSITHQSVFLIMSVMLLSIESLASMVLLISEKNQNPAQQLFLSRAYNGLLIAGLIGITIYLLL
ncbi:TPA: hypothetical protein OEA38_000064 [Legionella pneumophila]|nr:hypothetical protein [Legionella pneumophila]HAT9646386.1 hypothetical protein [Legionella pneumophila subsp. pneumophila]HCP5222306.1 hypothetical protein [Legionella pneumophila]